MVLERDSSEEVPVTSDVPQGSILRPILCLVYINDLPDKVKSYVRLFADDTAAYLAITKLAASKQLQIRERAYKAGVCCSSLGPHTLDNIQKIEKVPRRECVCVCGGGGLSVGLG